MTCGTEVAPARHCLQVSAQRSQLTTLEASLTGMESRVNDLLRVPKLWCHLRDLALLILSDEVLGMFKASRRGE